MTATPPNAVSPELPSSLVRLVQASMPGVRLLAVSALNADEPIADGSQKGSGYGAPLSLELETPNGPARWVLHTATANAFGHDRRADRAAEMLLAFDTFRWIPRHARVVDVGAYLKDGESCSLSNSGEFYLLTEWMPGAPYAHDLRELAERAKQERQVLREKDLRRTRNLARYLAELHRAPVPNHASSEVAYRRAARDLLGSGEGLFGIRDGYPESTPGASPERLDGIERRALRYRSLLRHSTHRLALTHGDFHPFNIVFQEGDDEPHLLDASRGCLGDPADDVICLTINYLFFGLISAPAAAPAFAELFRTCIEVYLAERPDPELLQVAPPFLAWRALVLCNPVWYPDISPIARDQLLSFVEETLDAGALNLNKAHALLSAGRPE